MFKNLFNRPVRQSADTEEVGALERLMPTSTAHDIGKVYPVVVPIECMGLEWPGPIEQIEQLPLALAWAVVNEGNLWLYVTFEQADFWERANVNWRTTAFQNLARLVETGGFGVKEDENGRPFVRVMLQDDAMGPSRLLIPHLFDDELGADYMVALPERTCAVAYRADLSGQQISDVNGMIDGCFEHGTEPVSPRRYRATQFWPPAARYWLHP